MAGGEAHVSVEGSGEAAEKGDGGLPDPAHSAMIRFCGHLHAQAYCGSVQEHSIRAGRAPAGQPKLAGVRTAARLTIGRMPGYEPVDLSAVCNAGVDVLSDEPGDVPLGRVDLRGLPFLIGSQPPSAERCFLLPGG